MLVLAFGAKGHASEFAFVYGMLPCANSVLVIVRGFGAPPTHISLVASYLALGKVVAFPLLFTCAYIFRTLDHEGQDGLDKIRISLSQLLTLASTIVIGWILVSALLIPVWRLCPLRRALCLAVATNCAFSLPALTLARLRVT